MEILSVTLKNFKSHSDRHFVFQPGTNAICGENGAGKTSILEAIAWVLFNYRGAYKNEDLIRNGANSAQISVAFVSNRDGRTYEVQRCTTKGYTLFDPQLGVKLNYKHIEEEVLPWLRQQLGVAPGTDLGKLFSNTIGVPQGTFTADFLQPPDKRKAIFDAILKVEEYRQTNQQMLSLEKYGKAEVESLDRSIAHYDESLQEQDSLQQRRHELQQTIVTNEATLQRLQTQLTQLQQQKEQLAVQAQTIRDLDQQQQQFSATLEAKQIASQALEQAVQRSQTAVHLCKTNRESYQIYQQMDAVLKDCDQQIKQRHRLQQQRDAIQQQQGVNQTQLAKLEIKLDAIVKAQAEIEALQPLIAQQLDLEQQQIQIVEQLNYLQTCKAELQTLTRSLRKVEADQTRLTQEIEQLQALQAVIATIPQLEQHRDRCQEQLSRVEAAKQFEAELRQLVTQGETQRDRFQLEAEQALATLQRIQESVPLLAAESVESVRQAIQAGVNLNTDLLHALWRILADLSEQISVPKLQTQLQSLQQQLNTAYQGRAAYGALATKQTQRTSGQTELTHLQTRIAELQTQLQTESDWQQQRQTILTQLQSLDNPRGRQQLLQQDLQQLDTLRSQETALQQQLQAGQQQLATVMQQLDAFADLDATIEQSKHHLQTHQPGYLTYLQHRDDANLFAKREGEWQTALADLQQLTTQLQTVQATLEQQRQDFDPDQYAQIEAHYTDCRSQTDRLFGSLPQQQQLLQELDHRLAALQALASKRQQAIADRDRKKKVLKFITFARKAYKEAGPRITERYVHSISREADRLFRELLSRPNVALQWTREYDIVVQEGAHSRRFINLSGGEQMCAALAVRLALLRVLADIDVAFFDEPTTNMDRPRRERLAESIANLRSFRQLFVISHDDTFEKVTENIIVVQREPA